MKGDNTGLFLVLEFRNNKNVTKQTSEKNWLKLRIDYWVNLSSVDAGGLVIFPPVIVM